MRSTAGPSQENTPVPLSSMPEETVEILDPEVPLADVPQTGDAGVSIFYLLLAACFGGMMMLKKRKEEDA